MSTVEKTRRLSKTMRSLSSPTEKSRKKRSSIKSASLSKIEESESLTDMITRELKNVFKDLAFEVDRNQTEEGGVVYYDAIRGFACERKESCECFALKVYHLPSPYVLVDRIRYKYADECKLTGSDILSRLTKTFREHNIRPIQLYDVAKIHIVVDGRPEQIKLSTYSILLNGISWYNKYGYLSDTHEHEVAVNNSVANTPIPPKLQKDVNKVFGDSYNVPIGTTFREFTQSVNEIRLDDSVSEEQKNKFMRSYLLVEEYLTKNKKIKYSYYDLKLR